MGTRKAKAVSDLGAVIPIEHIERRILVLRGHRVIIDADLARLYGATTKRLNEQVKRNADGPEKARI